MSKTKSHIPAKKLSEIKEVLERQLRRALRSMDGHEELAASVMEGRSNEDGVGRLEALESQAFLGKLADRDRVKVAAITRALQRIDRGIYGLCTGCSARIPLERLEVLPETEACVACS